MCSIQSILDLVKEIVKAKVACLWILSLAHTQLCQLKKILNRIGRYKIYVELDLKKAAFWQTPIDEKSSKPLSVVL